MFKSNKRVLSLVIGMASMWCQTAWAQVLDIEGWLRRPGVKLVAVEFYATWCKPCMEAVPRWKALHDKYQSEGLRFLVVVTQDPDGLCSNPGWTPDEVICDDDGFLARRFGATQLPAAYLWSWQGHLLAQKTHVDEVEAKIQDWMRTSARVDVEVGRVAAGAQVGRRALLDTIRGELKGSDKLVVVATAEERRTLRALIKKSLRTSADEALACDVGAEVTANSLVKASIIGGRHPRLQLQLLSAERGCLVASASTRWRVQNPVASVREAVAGLVGRLRLSATQYSWSRWALMSRSASPQPVDSFDFAALQRQTEEAERHAQAAAERLRKARAKAKAEQEKRLVELENRWEVVEKAVITRLLEREVRINALEQFLRIYPRDNPHLKKAQSYLKKLRSQKELESKPPVVSVKMVRIPGGTFIMGCQKGDVDCGSAEEPSHSVQIDEFYMDETEVTVEAYAECVHNEKCEAAQTGTYCNSEKPGKAQHPINCVTWYQAKKYCAVQGKQLPTEAQWEYAARARDGDLYPWGNAQPTDKQVRFGKDWEDGTTEVKSYPAGAHGLYDMGGNVWEWVEDCYDSDAYKRRSGDKVSHNPRVYPKRCSSGVHVLRGGSFKGTARDLRASSRRSNKPRLKRRLNGFRCARMTM